MEKQAGAAASSPRSPPASFLDPFTKLTNLLRTVDEEPKQLDASQEDAHKFVGEIWHASFGEAGVLIPTEHKAFHDALKAARTEENDWYEIYAYALDIFRRRQKKELDATEAAKDRGALVEKRREYIIKLGAFQEQASAIDHYLRESPSAS